MVPPLLCAESETSHHTLLTEAFMLPSVAPYLLLRATQTHNTTPGDTAAIQTSSLPTRDYGNISSSCHVRQ